MLNACQWFARCSFLAAMMTMRLAVLCSNLENVGAKFREQEDLQLSHLSLPNLLTAWGKFTHKGYVQVFDTDANSLEAVGEPGPYHLLRVEE